MTNNLSQIKSQLFEQYKFRIEMHAHTNPTSPCSEANPKDVIKIYSELGYSAVCITNHFISYLFSDIEIFKNLTKEQKIDRYLADFEEAYEEGKRLGINVILGCEVRFAGSDNDYLIYGVDRELLLKMYDYVDDTVESFRKNVPMPNSVFIQAHPFRNTCTPISPSLLDGIEAYNTHIHHNQKSPLAVRFAEENNIGIRICGSDFHHPNTGNEGSSSLRTKILPKDTFELADLLKSKDYIIDIAGYDIILP